MGPLPLPLRNRLAELILEALEPGEARDTLFALARALAADSCVDRVDVDRLLALEWFESTPSGRVQLLSAHRPHGSALADRSRRAASAVLEWEDRGGGRMSPLLDRAAALANRRLFFEVHELLEPVWLEAAEPVRTALQGLIQVAVAFHHLENGNREGARSLLALGMSKVAGAGPALPLETQGWLDELGATLATLAAGGVPAEIPRWPRSVAPQSRATS